MTGTEMKAIIEAKRKEGQELLSIMFDNGLYANFVDDDIFDTSNIKKVGGVDCVEIDTLSFPSGVIGAERIPMIAVHPIEHVQTMMFVPSGKKADIDPKELRIGK